MYNGIFILMIFCIFNAGLTFAQSDRFTLINTIPVKASMVTSDELGNVYTVNNNMLSKFDPDGKLLYTYSNLLAGDITFADPRDPFKVLVFYQGFGQIELLDNTLSLTTNTISLNMLGLELSTLACPSYQNGFWVYNPQNFELIRIDQFLEITDKTGNITKVTGFGINPNYLIERDNIVYMNDQENGIMLFDKFGTYYKTINIKGLDSFQIFGRKIIFTNDSTLTILDPKTLEEVQIDLPADNFKSAAFNFGTKEKRLFLIKNDQLMIYTFN